RTLGDLLRAIPLVKAEGAKGAEGAAVAVDGGLGIVDLADGGKVALARAAAVGPGVLEREFIVDVLKVDSSSAQWAYLVMAEALAARAAIEAAEGGRADFKYLLMDGSLYAKAIMLIHNLILTKEFQTLYYVPEMISALYALANMLKDAEAAGIKPVFVSKDSRFKVLKEYAAFEALKGKIDDYLVERGMQWYSIIWLRRFRRSLLAWYKRLQHDYEASAALGLLFKYSAATDHAVLASMAPRAHTLPMILGACDAYMAYKGLTTVPKLTRAVQERLEDSMMFSPRPDESLDEYLDMARAALSALPKILFFYLKPAEGAEPLLIEIPVAGSRLFDGTSVKAFYPQADVGDVVALLLSQYRDSAHYNTWLWYAHEVASFRRLAEYAVYLKTMLGDAMARRVKMALGI
ncbi:MAG: DNA double-strand break repair nuclease NurA, partial [Thermoproteus sp.]|nr:DNA double-strand break repair nuclease NurA [Thermoproteus sp.]